LSRELLYTGLTRAKRQFTYCGEQSVWVNAVSRHAARHSGLRIRLGIDQSNTATVANETAVSNGAAKPPEQGSLDF
jgi:exodeoxyribonuclease V alpha subunit